MGIFEQNPLAFFAFVTVLGGIGGYVGSWVRDWWNRPSEFDING